MHYSRAGVAVGLGCAKSSWEALGRRYKLGRVVGGVVGRGALAWPLHRLALGFNALFASSDVVIGGWKSAYCFAQLQLSGAATMRVDWK